MKAVVYSVMEVEKEPIAIANKKKHDITLVSNPLTDRSINFARGKRAVVVTVADIVSEKIIEQLAEMGVEYIATRSQDLRHIDLNAARKFEIQIGALTSGSVATEEQINQYISIASQVIGHLDNWDKILEKKGH